MTLSQLDKMGQNLVASQVVDVEIAIYMDSFVDSRIYEKEQNRGKLFIEAIHGSTRVLLSPATRGQTWLDSSQPTIDK